MKPRIGIVIAALLLFGGVCILENGAVRAKPPETVPRGSSSVYMLAGEFRTVFANLLWMKAEQYHHEFIKHNPHWAENRELIGLLTLITTLDPHFPEAYATGTSIYSVGYKNNRKALNYLIEGIHNNPRSWELHRLAVIMYARHFNDPERALFHARLAVKYCDDSFYRQVMMRLLKTVEGIQPKN